MSNKYLKKTNGYTLRFLNSKEGEDNKEKKSDNSKSNVKNNNITFLKRYNVSSRIIAHAQISALPRISAPLSQNFQISAPSWINTSPAPSLLKYQLVGIRKDLFVYKFLTFDYNRTREVRHSKI